MRTLRPVRWYPIPPSLLRVVGLPLFFAPTPPPCASTKDCVSVRTRSMHPSPPAYMQTAARALCTPSPLMYLHPRHPSPYFFVSECVNVAPKTGGPLPHRVQHDAEAAPVSPRGICSWRTTAPRRARPRRVAGGPARVARGRLFLGGAQVCGGRARVCGLWPARAVLHRAQPSGPVVALPRPDACPKHPHITHLPTPLSLYPRTHTPGPRPAASPPSRHAITARDRLLH